jgi:hypothetical protein
MEIDTANATVNKLPISPQRCSEAFSHIFGASVNGAVALGYGPENGMFMSFGSSKCASPSLGSN